MTTQASGKSQYDSIIVGSGLTGLLLARRLAEAGEKVAVLEAKELPGGHLGRTLTKGYSFHSSLEFVPDYLECTEGFEKVGAWLDLNILGVSRNLSPKTYQSGELRDFVGFGEIQLSSLDEVNWYTQSKSREMLVRPEELVERLLADAPFEVFVMSEVTSYNLEAGRVTSVTINAAKTIEARRFFHTGPVSQLTRLFPEGAIKPKEKSRLAKAHAWTTVGLHFLHRGLQTELPELLILQGTKTEPDPCVGRFFPAFSRDGQVLQESLWVSFIDPEAAEDMEALGGQIRNMKKQIKKAFPEALDRTEIEKITVTPESHGYLDLGLKEPFQLSQVDGFYLASPLMAQQRGVGSSVAVCVEVVESLGESLGGTPRESSGADFRDQPSEILIETTY